MSKVLISACLLALIFSVQSQDTTCTDTKFQICQNQMTESLGLNDTVATVLFRDYTIMYNYFLYMFGKTPGSTVDIVQVCNALESFNNCMRGNRGCLDISNLLKKTDINNAYAVDATFRSYLIFNCGPGINTLIHEGLSCPQRVLQNRQNVLQACMTSYITSVANDAQNGCNYGQALMNCWSAPFQTASCRRENGIAAWWACEQNAVFVKTTFPSCPLACDEKFGPNRSTSSGWLATNYKVVDGEEWFKISDHVEKQNGKLVTVEGKWMK